MCSGPAELAQAVAESLCIVSFMSLFSVCVCISRFNFKFETNKTKKNVKKN